MGSRNDRGGSGAARKGVTSGGLAQEMGSAPAALSAGGATGSLAPSAGRGGAWGTESRCEWPCLPGRPGASSSRRSGGPARCNDASQQLTCHSGRGVMMDCWQRGGLDVEEKTFVGQGEMTQLQEDGGTGNEEPEQGKRKFRGKNDRFTTGVG